RALGHQYRRDARADHLDSAVIDVAPQSLAYLVDRHLLCLFPARLLSDSDQHVARPTKLLQLCVAEPQPAERRAHLGKIRRTAFRLYLDQRAAHEIDAEIEPVRKVEKDGEDQKH